MQLVGVEGSEDFVLGARDYPWLIDVLDPHQPTSPRRPRAEKAADGGDQGTEVKRAAGGGGESTDVQGKTWIQTQMSRAIPIR